MANSYPGGKTSVKKIVVTPVVDEAELGRTKALLSGLGEYLEKVLRPITLSKESTSGLSNISDFAKEIDQLKNTSNLDSLSHAIENINRVASQKKFNSLKDIKSLFDFKGKEEYSNALQGYVDKIERYATALEKIAPLQKTVGKFMSEVPGSVIGQQLAEIEASLDSARKKLDSLYNPKNEGHQKDLAWKAHDEIIASYEKRAAAAKQAADAEAQLNISSTWQGASQGAAVLHDIEQAYLDVDEAIRKAYNDEIAIWDAAVAKGAPAEKKQELKEMETAYRNLENAAKTAITALKAQQKYTGNDPERLKQLQDTVDAAKQQWAEALKATQAYKGLALETGRFTKTQQVMIDLQMKYNALMDAADAKGRSTAETRAKYIADAWDSATKKLNEYNKNLSETGDQNVANHLLQLQEIVARLNELRGKAEVHLLTSDDLLEFVDLQDKISTVTAELNRMQEAFGITGQSAQGIREAGQLIRSVNSELNSILKSSNSWAETLGSDNKFSVRAKEIYNGLNSLKAQFVNGTISAEDFRKKVEDLKTELSSLSADAGRAISDGVLSRIPSGGITNEWSKARKSLEEYQRAFGEVTSSSVNEHIEQLKEIERGLDNIRGRAESHSLLPGDLDEFHKLQEQLVTVTAELDRLRSIMRNSGESAEGFREAERALDALHSQLSSISKTSGDWVEKLGSGNKFTPEANRIYSALQELEGQFIRGEITIDGFKDKLASLKSSFIELSANANKELSSGMFTRGTAEWQDALSKLDTAISNLDRKLANMSAARTGKAFGDYQELLRIRAEYKQTRDEVDNCTIAKEKYRATTAKLVGEERTHTNAIEMAGEATKTFSERIVDVASKLSSWISPMRIVMYVIRTIRQMISTSIELDSALTQLRVVTKASSDEMEKFGEATAKTAAEIGASIKDLIDSTTVFSRLGYTLDESSLLAKYTAMLKQVGDIDIGDAQNAVTAITKAFSDEIKIGDIESVMDRLVEVGKYNCPAA